MEIDPYITDIYAKIEAMENNDPNGHGYHNLQHAVNVMNMASEILKDLKADKRDVEDVKVAALLHDIGCLEGKENHEIRGYDLAKKYLDENQNLVHDKHRVLEAIKNHRDGFESDDIITLALIFSDKLDLKYTRVAPAGKKEPGMKELLHVLDITVEVVDKLKVKFVTDGSCNKKELETYYFIPKVFKSISKMADKLNKEYEVYFDENLWHLDYLKKIS